MVSCVVLLPRERNQPTYSSRICLPVLMVSRSQKPNPWRLKSILSRASDTHSNLPKSTRKLGLKVLLVTCAVQNIWRAWPPILPAQCVVYQHHCPHPQPVSVQVRACANSAHSADHPSGAEIRRWDLFPSHAHLQ